MNWKTIRLELAPTDEFPGGSASRAYMLRLPLLEDGSIDEQEIEKNPDRATMHRFWASEPDRTGHVVHADFTLAFSFHAGSESSCKLESRRFCPESEVILTTDEGCELPFRVVSVK